MSGPERRASGPPALRGYTRRVRGLIPFRRRRWTRSRDYGADEGRLRSLDEFKAPAFKGRMRWPEDQVTVRGVARETGQWLGKLRPFILGGILLSVWPAMDPALLEPPTFLSTDPEHVAEEFTRCGPGRGHACVIDGDTFKLGQRKVRIIGIDAPETHPSRCAEEARLGEAATAEAAGVAQPGPVRDGRAVRRHEGPLRPRPARG